MVISHNITWIAPEACIPPHKVARPEQVKTLAEEFSSNGWGTGYPALVGYYLNWQRAGQPLQLLSGSHRWAAAVRAGLDVIPVSIIDYSVINKFWGNLIPWAQIMDAPLVEK